MQGTETPLVVREQAAARLLGVTISALRRWRRERRGPPFVRLERCVGYRVADLEAFLESNTVTHNPAHALAAVQAAEETHP